MNLRSGISILSMVLLVTIAACSGDDTPSANTLIIGDRSTVDFFQAFTPPLDPGR